MHATRSLSWCRLVFLWRPPYTNTAQRTRLTAQATIVHDQITPVTLLSFCNNATLSWNPVFQLEKNIVRGKGEREGRCPVLDTQAGKFQAYLLPNEFHVFLRNWDRFTCRGLLFILFGRILKVLGENIRFGWRDRKCEIVESSR